MDRPAPPVTRFAPSPNGRLHLGHALSAIVAHDLARAGGGRFLLRIEDIDGPRSRPELADDFRRDLEWLGLEWEEVRAQSTRLTSYAAAAEALKAKGLLYPCTCTRKEIEEAGAVEGSDGLIYPGTCKHRPPDPLRPAAWRLDSAKALAATGPLVWEDALAGPQAVDLSLLGDVVLVRKDLPASYHLAVTLDDAADGVTLVTRGADLFAASHVHRTLQALLGLPVPRWHHHPLLLGEDGEKLAKRRGSPALTERREAGEDGRMLAEQLRVQLLSLGT
ncbi:tRNA glutamyl-Q(34) synthetase GluQRS [Erythrobacter oryzae]|uniref:tRNA glutamyl-Q(34) synthetase GluQRS n=1 Tax=Erythrobacter oryzae TaxID=3019556 RepID=UPI00255761A8|nr:tRNA glutamyl-Q(34) synthetase GluQRS [Erythrobacter sp. COR-2]